MVESKWIGRAIGCTSRHEALYLTKRVQCMMGVGKEVPEHKGNSAGRKETLLLNNYTLVSQTLSVDNIATPRRMPSQNSIYAETLHTTPRNAFCNSVASKQ